MPQATAKTTGPSPGAGSSAGASSGLSNVDDLSVADLKRIILAAGLQSDDCLEKSELRTRAREAIEALQREERPSASVGARRPDSHAAATAKASARAGGSSVANEGAAKRRRAQREVADAEHGGGAQEDRPTFGSSTGQAEVVRKRRIICLSDDEDEDSHGEAEAEAEVDVEVDVDVEVEVDEELEAESEQGESATAVKAEESDGEAPHGELLAAVTQRAMPDAPQVEVVKLEGAGSMDMAPIMLDMGTRLEIFWEGDNEWFAGCVASRYSAKKGGNLIRYEDGQKQWENLDEVIWRWPTAEAKHDAKPEVYHEEQTAPLSPALAPVTRSKRHDVKVCNHSRPSRPL